MRLGMICSICVQKTKRLLIKITSSVSVLSSLTGHLQEFEAQFTLSPSSLLTKLQDSLLKLHHQSLLEFSLIPTALDSLWIKPNSWRSGNNYFRQ